LNDDEYERFIHYMESSSNLVLDVMIKEKEASLPAKEAGSRAAAKPKARTKAKAKAPRKKAAPHKRAPAAKRRRS